MKRYAVLFVLVMVSTISYAQKKISQRPLTPLQLYGNLFKAVQMKSIFSDGKTFVDCTPKSMPKLIMLRYRKEKDEPGFNLRHFVLANFNLPVSYEDNYHSDTSESVAQHIDELWSVLTRKPENPIPYSSLLQLPCPYVVPGGRFREMYYWDSYFTMLGLKVDGKKHLLEDMVKDFAYLINKYGFIPNGTRSYYLTRSQPPFFALMVDLLAEEKGNSTYVKYQKALLEEYHFWMKGVDSLNHTNAYRNVVRLPDGSILNRYWDLGNYPREESWKADVDEAKKTKEPDSVFYRNIRATAESGMDFSSRWFADGEHLYTIRTTDIVAVDLNCLLYHLEQTIAWSYKESESPLKARIFLQKAKEREKAILKYCWSPKHHFFMDYLINENKPSPELTLAGMFPLFFHIATHHQAKEVKQVIKNKFLKQGGVVTTLKNTGQQWDAPNGWAPLEYITIEALNNYGFSALAREIALRWINLNIKVYKNTGKLMEKYNVENIHLQGGGGEYPLQDGFGWTNGVLLKLLKRYRGTIR